MTSDPSDVYRQTSLFRLATQLPVNRVKHNPNATHTWYFIICNSSMATNSTRSVFCIAKKTQTKSSVLVLFQCPVCRQLARVFYWTQAEQNMAAGSSGSPLVCPGGRKPEAGRRKSRPVLIDTTNHNLSIAQFLPSQDVTVERIYRNRRKKNVCVTRKD